MKPGLMNRLARLEERDLPSGPVVLFAMDTGEAEVSRQAAALRAAIGPLRMLVVVSIDLRDPPGGWPQHKARPEPIDPAAAPRAARIAELERELAVLTGTLPN